MQRSGALDYNFLVDCVLGNDANVGDLIAVCPDLNALLGQQALAEMWVTAPEKEQGLPLRSAVLFFAQIAFYHLSVKVVAVRTVAGSQ